MSRRRHLEQGSLFALSLLPLMMAASGAAAQALPSGGTVTSGAAAIGYTSANDMTVTQTSGKAIINWTDFSIGQGKSVTFENGKGATLNRVTGANVSNLMGSLNASGSVYLINPNGVIIGSTGVVNVGGSFVASSLNVTDANFLAGGTLTFQGSGTAAVKNLGQVGALGGDVVLIASTVTNEGQITAGGTAALAAGSKVVMREASTNNSSPSVMVTMGDSSLDGGRFTVEIGAGDVTNVGAIAAAEAELRANGGNIYALAGNTGGTITAGNPSNNNAFSVMSPGYSTGRVFLTAGTGNVTSSGAITASDTVTMQGAQVAIGGSVIEADSLTIDADSFAIGDAEATVFNHLMAYGAGYDPDTGNYDYRGANVSITAHTGDIVLDTTDVGLNIADRQLNLTAFGNVTFHDAVSATRHYDYPWGSYEETGSLYARSDSSGTGTGVVSGLSLNQGYAQVTTNVADYSTYQAQVDAMAAGNPSAEIYLTMLVNTYADLKRIATDNDGGEAAGQFQLTHDIDASASADGGYVGAVLTGGFDGDGHTISNLQVTASDAGLFAGLNGAEVGNFNLSGGAVTGSHTAGAVAGYANGGSISNVTSSMNVSNASTDIDAATGGIVGQASGASISSVNVSGDVTGANKVGGIVGHASSANIYSSDFSGQLTGADKVGGITGLAENSYLSSVQMTGSVTGGNSVGGVAGIFQGSQYYYVSGATVSGSVTGTGSDIGGLVGMLNGGRLQFSEFTGVVTGGTNTGGLAGEVQNSYGYNNRQVYNSTVSGSVTGGDNTGGLVGLLGSSTNIQYSTSTGVVSGHDNVGGAVGSNSSNTFYYVEASGVVTGSGRNVGGLVGSNNGAINYGAARGDVVGAGGVGGLVGYSSGTISNSSASGAVTGLEIQDADGDAVITSVGGLVGLDYYGSVYSSSASGAVGGQGSYFGGLLGYIYGANVQNSFATGAVTGQHDVGGLIGAAGNLSLSDSYATGAVTGGDYEGPYDHGDEAAATGGLIGLIRDTTTIDGGYATGKVTGVNNTGGLVGLVARNADIQNSWANGDVTGADNVGGLIGGITLQSYANASLTNTYATGRVIGGDNVGGLVGLVQGQSQYDPEEEETYTSVIAINDSYAEGAVTGANKVGGLVGKVDQGIINIANIYETGSVTGQGSVGGLIGSMFTGVTISDGYATGAVSGDTEVGGLFGHYTGSLVSNLYWDTDSSGTLISRGNDAANLDNTTGLTRDQAFSAGSYAFSDASHWVFIDGVRPLLASEWSTNITSLHQLQLMARDMSANYTLSNDISAAQANVGGSSVFKNGFVGINSLSGSLDGQGHKISNLTILSGANNVGLFGTIQSGGLVRDLSLVDSTITSTANAGHVGAIAGTNNGTISIVSNSGSVTGLALNGAYAGGLVGYNAGAVELSASKGAVTGGAAGGVSGYNSGTIVNSYASAVVTGSSKVGGITGELSSTGAIDTVLSTGNLVSSGTAKVGALVGYGNGGAVNNGRWSTTVIGPRGIAGFGSVTGSNNLGYSTADLQDETKTADVYAGFDLNGVWALGSSAAVSGDGQAHFAELYRADNVLVVNANTTGTYGDDGFGDGYSWYGYLRGNDGLNVAVDASAYGSTTHAGTYQMGVQATVNGGGSYRVVKLGTLTVNKRQVYVDLKDGVTKTYDGTDTAVLTNDAFNQYGVRDGDSLTVTGTGTYASSGVGSGISVTAGNLVVGGANASDYEVLTDGPLVSNVGYINHALVTGTVTSTKTYDGTTALGANATTSLTGLVGDETLGATFTNVAYADKNAGTDKALTGGLSVDLSSETGANYAVTSFDVAGTGQIAAKTITAGLGGTITKTYDGATTATLGDNLALSGLVAGDKVTVGAGGAAYADKNAGTSKTVTVNGVTISGVDAGNYVLASTTASANVGAITQKALTITANNQVKNRNDADPTLTYVSTGLVTGDSLTGALTRDAGEAVGAYGILQGTLSGGGNYAVTYNRALLTINLGIPPVENLVIPYMPADGGGSTASGGSTGSGGAGGQKDGGTSVGFQLAVQDAGGKQQSKQQQGGDDTTACAAGEACQAAPYTQGGSTSGAIHFQGFMQ